MVTTTPNRIIRPQLYEDEELIWAGMPKQGVRLRASDLFLIPFSVAWTGFAFGANFTAMLGGYTGYAVQILLVTFGAYLLVGRFFADSIRRQNTYYGVTSYRIIIVTGLTSFKVDSYELAALEDISLIRVNGNRGIIDLGLSHPLTGWLSGIPWPGLNQLLSPCFELIENAPQVYAKIMWARRNLMLPPEQREKPGEATLEPFEWIS